MASIKTSISTSSYTIAPHNVIINRTSRVPQSTSSRESTASANPPPNVSFNEGNYSVVTAKGVSEVKANRDQEKKELSELNDRFSNYLDKVRNLEAQNRKLADDLEKLKSKWGKETTQIKAMYQAELDDARQTLNDAEREKARLEIKVASLEEQIEEIRAKLQLAQHELSINKEINSKQTQQIAAYEREIELLRKQLENLETEHNRDQTTISNLENVLLKTREDLDTETLAHIDQENRRQTLEEEIEFLKSVHDKEMKELADLAYRDNSSASRDFWKNELAQAIREIEHMYGEKLEDMKGDMEGFYNHKLQEFRTGAARQSTEANKSKEDCKDLRNNVTEIRDRINDLDAKNHQLAREIEKLKRGKEDSEREWESRNALLRDETHGLRGDLDAVMHELEGLLGTKMTLDLEIAAYRKLLEYEENRNGIKVEKKDDTTVNADEDEGSFARGEMSAKTTYSRTAKGAMAISDCPPDGRFVRLENSGKKEENIVGYTIQRIVDNRPQPPYALDSRFEAVKPGQKITIWAKGFKPEKAPAQDIEIDEFTWGIGSNVITKLSNPEGEERASLTQKTTYS